jgi:GDP-L-fucose synthase
MKILITGSNGMVGHNLLENKDITKNEILKPSSRELNLLNYNNIQDYLKNNKPDIIIHCAGKVGGIQANMNDLYGFFTDNLIMGINLVKAAKDQGVENLLNLSSSCVYPRNCKNPLKEEYILTGALEPTNEGYALAKLSVQRMCEYISRECHGYLYKTLIPCNLYGRWDKFDDNRSHMIPAVIKKIHDAIKIGNNNIEIWGDGAARREFMYASDLASCIGTVINNFASVPAVMNVGVGLDYSINEYYEVIKKVLGYKGGFSHDKSKPVGIKQKLLDITRQTRLGWRSTTSLEEGIQKTYLYFLKHNNGEIL